jgi:hypothetical protein
LRAFRKPRHREGGILNEGSYQIGNRASWKKTLVKPAHRCAGQGGDAGYCFDETSEQ